MNLQSISFNRSDINSIFINMPKKSIQIRNLNIQNITKNLKYKRKIMLLHQVYMNINQNEFFVLNKKIQKEPKNGISIRIRTRCWKTGRSRSILKYFGICRNILREYAHIGLLPGVIKSSW